MMKKTILLAVLLSMGCSSATLVDNWKNPDIVLFHADKVLLVGMTQSEDARDLFESGLEKEFKKRNVDVMRSIDLFDVQFTNSKKSEEELDNVEQQLLDKGFDAILFTKIIGSENRQTLRKSISEWDRDYRRFGDDYMEYQDIYYDDNYYDQFKVYHAETSLYCICEGKERALIWRGGIDVTDPTNIEKSIDDYIKLVVLAMEEQDLIFFKSDKNEITGL